MSLMPRRAGATLPRTRAAACVVLCTLAGCSPALNWRAVKLPESDLVATFPCRPDQMMRSVPLAGAKVTMRLATCAAQGMTFAIGYATLAQPSQIAEALTQLRTAAALNIGAREGAASAPWTVKGMTPHALAQRWEMLGRRADDKPVVERVGLFTKGLTVYQATVVGTRVEPEAADTFFGGLSLSP